MKRSAVIALDCSSSKWKLTARSGSNKTTHYSDEPHNIQFTIIFYEFFFFRSKRKSFRWLGNDAAKLRSRNEVAFVLFLNRSQISHEHSHRRHEFLLSPSQRSSLTGERKIEWKTKVSLRKLGTWCDVTSAGLSDLLRLPRERFLLSCVCGVFAGVRQRIMKLIEHHVLWDPFGLLCVKFFFVLFPQEYWVVLWGQSHVER